MKTEEGMEVPSVSDDGQAILRAKDDMRGVVLNQVRNAGTEYEKQ
jgi:hypothetical protein